MLAFLLDNSQISPAVARNLAELAYFGCTGILSIDQLGSQLHEIFIVGRIYKY